MSRILARFGRDVNYSSPPLYIDQCQVVGGGGGGRGGQGGSSWGVGTGRM